MAWGTKLLLTATPAAAILVYWDNTIILKRGLIGKGDFIPGAICKKAKKENICIPIGEGENCW